MVRLGYFAVAGAAVLWATGGTYARVLMDRGASPVELTEARAWIAVVGVGVLVAARGRRPSGRQAAGSIKGLLVFFGLALAAANFTYYLAISLLPVAVAIVIQYTAPGLVVAWKAIEDRRPPSSRVAGALGLAFAGVLLLSEVLLVAAGGETTLHPVGVLIAAASAVSFATYVVVGERVGSTLGPERSVFYGFVVASAFWVLVQLTRGRPDTLLDLDFLPGVLFLGVAGTIAPFLLFIWGLRIVRASPAGIVSTLEPVAAAILAFLWLGQTLTPLQVAGAASVVVGIAIVQTVKPPSPEELAERAAVE